MLRVLLVGYLRSAHCGFMGRIRRMSCWFGVGGGAYTTANESMLSLCTANPSSVFSPRFDTFCVHRTDSNNAWGSFSCDWDTPHLHIEQVQFFPLPARTLASTLYFPSCLLSKYNQDLMSSGIYNSCSCSRYTTVDLLSTVQDM